MVRTSSCLADSEDLPAPIERAGHGIGNGAHANSPAAGSTIPDDVGTRWQRRRPAHPPAAGPARRGALTGRGRRLSAHMVRDAGTDHLPAGRRPAVTDLKTDPYLPGSPETPDARAIIPGFASRPALEAAGITTPH